MNRILELREKRAKPCEDTKSFLDCIRGNDGMKVNPQKTKWSDKARRDP